MNLGMRGSFMGENGEIPWLAVPVVDAPSVVGRGVAGRLVDGPRGER